MPANDGIERPPIRVVTRLLVEMQTAILSVGVAALNGDLNRFAIFLLIARQTTNERASISAASLAASLDRPYETVRRHAHALVAEGMCEKRGRGFALNAAALHNPQIARLVVMTHDSFVRFVDDLARYGVPLPEPRGIELYRSEVGLHAATDIMLGVADTNRPTHGDWLDLAIYATIHCANVGRAIRDPAFTQTYRDETTVVPRELYAPVRPSVIAQTTGISDATVRRRIASMLNDGRIVRAERGVIVSDAWLNQPALVATSTASYYCVRRILQRIALTGFPFERPSSAYLSGRPADMNLMREAAFAGARR